MNFETRIHLFDYVKLSFRDELNKLFVDLCNNNNNNNNNDDYMLNDKYKPSNVYESW
jgi:hypothetical protein